MVYLTQFLPWKRVSVCLIIIQPVGWLLTARWPGRKSLSLTVWPSIALMQVPARRAPWRVPAEEHHQPWDQLLPDHRAHHLDPVWDSGGRVHRGRPGRLQSACHWVHTAGRWDLVSLSHSQGFFCYLTVAASIGHCVFIYSFSSAEGGSMLVWTGWCSTCLHATLRSTLSFHVDTTFILEPSSQTANFHANPLQNNYVNYVQGPLFSSDEKNASWEIQSLLIWTFWMIIWGAANVSTLLWGFICLIILNRHNINRVCQAIE